MNQKRAVRNGLHLVVATPLTLAPHLLPLSLLAISRGTHSQMFDQQLSKAEFVAFAKSTKAEDQSVGSVVSMLYERMYTITLHRNQQGTSPPSGEEKMMDDPATEEAPEGYGCYEYDDMSSEDTKDDDDEDGVTIQAHPNKGVDGPVAEEALPVSSGDSGDDGEKENSDSDDDLSGYDVATDFVEMSSDDDVVSEEGPPPCASPPTLSIAERVVVRRGLVPTTRHDRTRNFTEGTRLARVKRDPAVMARGYMITTLTSAEFLNRITSIGEVIIRDHFKPLEDRVFRPKDVGGTAGGTKYIEDGLFFKFADPLEGPYGGSFEVANKAVGHELKGAIAVFHAAQAVVGDGADDAVMTSLLAVVHHLGFCVLVMPQLPLDRGTLKVGSNDACRTLPHGTADAVEQSLNKRMNQVARQMGLAVHEIRRGGRVVQLGFGADVEGHMDRHGVARIVDTARVFPPEYPQGAAHLPRAPRDLSIFWRLLRPELVAMVAVKESLLLLKDGHAEPGLSADGFSAFSNGAEDAYVHMRRIVAATRILMDVQVPKAAAVLAARPLHRWWDGAGLTVIFHRLGINMRHCGAVWGCLGERCEELRQRCSELGADRAKNEEALERTKSELNAYGAARRAVVQELFVRSAKNLLRGDLRRAMKMGAGVHAIEEVASETFTCLASGGAGAEAHLKAVWQGVEERFGVKVESGQRSGVSAIRAIQRVAVAVGVRLTQSCFGDLKSQVVEEVESEQSSSSGGIFGGGKNSSTFIFTAADIESMMPRVKFLDIDDFAQGETLREQARAEAVSAGHAAPQDSGGEDELQVGDCCCLLRNGDKTAVVASDTDSRLYESLVGRRIKVRWPGDKNKNTFCSYDGAVGGFDPVTGMHRVAYDAVDTKLDEDEEEEKQRVVGRYRCIGTSSSGNSAGETIRGVLFRNSKEMGDIHASGGCVLADQVIEAVDDGNGWLTVVSNVDGSSDQRFLPTKVAASGCYFERTHAGSDAVEGCWHDLAKERERFTFAESKLYYTAVEEQTQRRQDQLTAQSAAQFSAQIAEERRLANWFSGRGRILAQCDAKFTAALATFGGQVVGKKSGNMQRTIASIRLGRVECLCLGGAATDTAVERMRAGVGWEARVRKVDAFAAIALIEGDGERSAAEMKVEPTVALFKMLCGAKMSGMAWEGVEEHVLRSMRRGGETRRGSSGDNAGEGGERKGGDETKRAAAAGEDGVEGGVNYVWELLGRLLDIDYYSNAMREKVVEEFVGGGVGDGGNMPPSAVVRLLDEARWLSLQVGDKVKAWNRINGIDSAYIAATIKGDNRNGTYAVEYEDPSQTSDDIQNNDNCPVSSITDYMEEGDFRRRHRGTRVDSLQNRQPIHSNPAAVDELLRWSREDMGGWKRVAALVVITPDLALEKMWVAVGLRGGDAISRLVFPCRNVGQGNVNTVDAEGGKTCLHKVAATTGDAEVAALLLAQNANVDAQEHQDGKTSLCLAVDGGHLNLARLLIRNGAAVNLGDRKEQTPLFIATMKNQIGMVALLVKEGKANINRARNDGCTALFYAASEAYIEIVELLVKGGADVNQSSHLDGTIHSTPLIIATQQNGNIEIIELLIKEGKADTNLARSDGVTAIYLASQLGHAEIVALLIGEGQVDVNRPIADGGTSLHIAAATGQSEVVAMLIQEGNAEVNRATNSGETPLLRAIASGHFGIAAQLVAGGANVNQANINFDSPLNFTCKQGNVAFSALLLKAGADVDHANSEGVTGLIVAAHQGCTEVVELLIKSGVDVNQVNREGTSPLHLATSEGHIKVVDLLVGEGKAVVNNSTTSGVTPLFIAASKGYRTIAALLVNKGQADADQATNDGTTPLCNAARLGYMEIVSFLIQEGAATVDKPTSEGATPLLIAAQHGRADVVALLLEHGAAVDHAKSDGATALIVAAQQGLQGHMEVISLLIKQGDVNKPDNTGINALFFACQLGKVEVVALLVGEGNADVNQTNNAGITPLVVAVFQGHADVAEILVNEGADVNQLTSVGSALYLAASKGDAKVVSLLLGGGQVIVNQAAADGATALSVSSQQGHTEVVRLLVTNADVNQATNAGWTPLFSSAAYGHTEVAKLLIKEEADVNQAAPDGSTPLSISVQQGHLLIAALLVKEGLADVNQAKIDGTTPLSIATQHGHAEIVALLVGEGNADVNQTNSQGWTPLFIASAYGRTEVAELLINEGKAEVNQVAHDGSSPLSIASQQGHTSIVALLVKDGQAAVNRENSGGVTSLIVAAQHGRIEIAALLIKAGANVNHIDRSAASPLFYASQQGHVDVVALLVKEGEANVNQAGGHGVTPLIMAAARGCTAIVSTLLEHGAGVNQSLSDGQSPLFGACESGHADIAALLIQAGASVNLRVVDSSPIDPSASGMTALGVARRNGHGDLAAVLVNAGADE